MRLLLTFFDPCEGETLHLSELLASFEGKRIAGVDMKVLKLPLVFREARDQVLAALHELKPQAIIGVGQKSRRDRIILEEGASKRRDSSFSYSQGMYFHTLPMINHGPDFFVNPLFFFPFWKRLTRKGIPTLISRDVGTYVGNDLYYYLLYHQLITSHSFELLFIHMPYLQEQEKEDIPSISNEIQGQALILIIEELVSSKLATISTRRLLLRPLLEDQLDAHGKNPVGLARELDLASIKPLPDMMKKVYQYKIAKIKEDPSNLLFYTYWLIIDSKKRRVLGSIGPKGLPDKEGAIEIGYGLEEEARGESYMEEAILAFIPFAWEHLKVTKIKATTLRNNLASQRILEKSGFLPLMEDGQLLTWSLTQVMDT